LNAPAERAGYSQRSLSEKLGIKAGHRIAFVAAPKGFDATLGPLPAGVRRARELRGTIDLIVMFAGDAAGLSRKLTSAKRAISPGGMLWVCWPKKTSGVVTDVDESFVREIGLAAGLVDVKICAVDATWSGLKFVYRLRDRPAAIKPRRAPRKK
jgi:Protein of unknown function (DUF3052)